jgi:hypothetical protein
MGGQGTDRLFGFGLGVEVGDSYIGTAFRKGKSNGAAYASGCSGDEHGLSL